MFNDAANEDDGDVKEEFEMTRIDKCSFIQPLDSSDNSGTYVVFTRHEGTGHYVSVRKLMHPFLFEEIRIDTE